MLGNGSDELISLLAMACDVPGAKILAPEPGFVMYAMSAQLQANGLPQGEGSLTLLDDIVARSRVARTPTEHDRAKDLITELVREVLQGTVVVSDNLSATLDARIAEIDQLISTQLSEVMHAAEFQRRTRWVTLCRSHR